MDFESSTDRLLRQLDRASEAGGILDQEDYFQHFRIAVGIVDVVAGSFLDEDLMHGQEAQQLSDWARYIKLRRQHSGFYEENIGVVEAGIHQAMARAYADAEGTTRKSRSSRGGKPGIPPQFLAEFIEPDAH